MAKSKALIAAEAKIAALEAQVGDLQITNGRIAALEARLELAREVYRNQRAEIAELTARLSARGAKKVVPTSWQWVKRDGTQMVSVRTGNKTVSRPVAAH